ncbi:hypothetical protein M0805_005646 [Coniferiporia weirii]|nr:hypothetical protein M0805_005646 [Coniferiporia weirii]
MGALDGTVSLCAFFLCFPSVPLADPRSNSRSSAVSSSAACTRSVLLSSLPSVAHLNLPVLSSLATALWGAGSVQLYFYYDKYSKTDKTWLKFYVLVIYGLDTLHQIFLLASFYSYFVTNFANIAHLNVLERPLINTTICTSIVDALVQGLFVMRIWHLSRQNYLLMGVLCVFIAGQFVVTVTYFGKIYHFTELAQLATAITTECVMNSIIAFVDTVIATVLSLLLHSRRSGVRQTNSLISRLILYTISTGMLTSVFSIIALVTAIVLPNKFIYLIPDLIMPKLYTNSILALLNSREKLRSQLIGDNSARGVSLNNISVRPFAVGGGTGGTGGSATAAGRSNIVSIKIDTERSDDSGNTKDPWQRSASEVDEDSSYAA